MNGQENERRQAEGQMDPGIKLAKKRRKEWKVKPKRRKEGKIVEKLTLLRTARLTESFQGYSMNKAAPAAGITSLGVEVFEKGLDPPASTHSMAEKGKPST